MNPASSALVAAAESDGPLDVINGLPTHPLVVHAAVVLIPMSALALIVMAFWRHFSRRYGWLVVGLAAVALGASFVAAESGEALSVRVGGAGFDHSQLGDRMPIFVAVLLGATVLLWLFDRPAPIPRRIFRWLLSGLAVIVAIANLVWVYLVGDSGAKSVWSGVVAAPAEIYLPFL